MGSNPIDPSTGPLLARGLFLASTGDSGNTRQAAPVNGANKMPSSSFDQLAGWLPTIRKRCL